MKMKKIPLFVAIIVVALVAGYLVWWMSSSQQPSAVPPLPPAGPSGGTATSSSPENSAMPYEAVTVMIVNKLSLGSYLADNKGRTLYNFTKDSPGVSACIAADCVKLWPAFYASTVNVQAPLQGADFTTFVRSDDQSQTAYKGKPLYYYTGDAAPGDTNGQGLNGFWFVALP